jgi:hypothetical protein
MPGEQTATPRLNYILLQLNFGKTFVRLLSVYVMQQAPRTTVYGSALWAWFYWALSARLGSSHDLEKSTFSRETDVVRLQARSCGASYSGYLCRMTRTM